ncbi:hypothetical protein T439DRAFT_383309 [Meredithblackwellia eburnea MCA 4105]
MGVKHSVTTTKSPSDQNCQDPSTSSNFHLPAEVKEAKSLAEELRANLSRMASFSNNAAVYGFLGPHSIPSQLSKVNVCALEMSKLAAAYDHLARSLKEHPCNVLNSDICAARKIQTDWDTWAESFDRAAMKMVRCDSELQANIEHLSAFPLLAESWFLDTALDVARAEMRNLGLLSQSDSKDENNEHTLAVEIKAQKSQKFLLRDEYDVLRFKLDEGWKVWSEMHAQVLPEQREALLRAEQLKRLHLSQTQPPQPLPLRSSESVHQPRHVPANPLVPKLRDMLTETKMEKRIREPNKHELIIRPPKLIPDKDETTKTAIEAIRSGFFRPSFTLVELKKIFMLLMAHTSSVAVASGLITPGASERIPHLDQRLLEVAAEMTRLSSQFQNLANNPHKRNIDCLTEEGNSEFRRWLTWAHDPSGIQHLDPKWHKECKKCDHSLQAFAQRLLWPVRAEFALLRHCLRMELVALKTLGERIDEHNIDQIETHAALTGCLPTNSSLYETALTEKKYDRMMLQLGWGWAKFRELDDLRISLHIQQQISQSRSATSFEHSSHTFLPASKREASIERYLEITISETVQCMSYWKLEYGAEEHTQHFSQSILGKLAREMAKLGESRKELERALTHPDPAIQACRATEFKTATEHLQEWKAWADKTFGEDIVNRACNDSTFRSSLDELHVKPLRDEYELLVQCKDALANSSFQRPRTHAKYTFDQIGSFKKQYFESGRVFSGVFSVDQYAAARKALDYGWEELGRLFV